MHQFSSVQFSSSWYLCDRKSPCALHLVSQTFPKRCLWNGSNVRRIEDGPLSSFQGRSSSASSFNASPPSDRWCDVLGFVPADSVSTLQVFREASSLWGLLCPPVCLPRSRFPSVCHVQDSTPTGVLEGGCQPLIHSSLGFPCRFSLSVASSLNLWVWWHVWSDCDLLRQSSGGHGWLLPPPLSSWRLRPYRLHCLRGW